MNKLPIISNYSKVSKTIEKDTFQPLGQYPTDEKFQLSFRYFEQQQFSVCPLWIFITTWGILWMIFSTRLKSALTCHKKFLWRGCLFFSDGESQQSRVAFIQRQPPRNTISIFFSHVKNLHHHHWNVLKLFLDCDNFHVPIFCSLIVLSGYYLLSCFCCCSFKVHMEIPINGCKLFACFVNFVTVTQVW